MIADLQAELDAFYSDLFPSGSGPASGAPQRPREGRADASDEEVLARARASKNGARFARLFDDGDLGAHGGDHSAADQALANLLAFWTGGDPARVDGLFRRSALFRPKWDEKHAGDGRTYGQMTVATALAGRTEFYDPAPPLRVVRGGKDAPPPPDGAEPAPEAEPPRAAENPTDLGNARRLVRQHGADLRYCRPWNKWLAWDGTRWAVDDTGEAERRAKRTVAGLYHEAAEQVDDGDRKRLAKHALASESAARIKAMLSLAETEPGVPVLPDQLDRDPWLLNVANGTIDLRTGELRPHRRDDLITKLCPVAYDPAAACPTWEAFLDRIFAGKADLIGFMQRAIGYALTGRTDERAIFILFGTGRNGKSTLLDTVLAILADYAARTATDTLLATRDNAIPNDVARLKGARFVFASEAEEGRRLAEAKVKDLTGGDTITARFMRGEWFDFRPEFKLFLGTNHKPNVKGTDAAIWDRIRLVPFGVRIPEAEQDKALKDKLLAEAPGILAWAVEGCLAWQRDGLGEPAEVRAATAAYRAESDLIGRFLEDGCVLGENALATAKALYARYTTWCEETGEKPVSQTAFGKRLQEHGLASVQLGKERARHWIGIGLRGDQG